MPTPLTSAAVTPGNPPRQITTPATPPAFAAYVLRVGPYAGRRLSVVAAVDPTWLLLTLAAADMEAVDATAIRGFLKTHPPLVVGDGVIMGAHPFVTIAPGVAPDGADGAIDMPQWHLRVAGELALSFARLDAARAYGEETCGVRQWVRVTNGVIIGEAMRHSHPGPQ